MHKLPKTASLRWGAAALLWAILGAAGSAHAEPFAYVSNTFSNSVSVIDTATQTVAATVPVGTNPLGVAVNTAATRVFVANSGQPYGVSVIDTASNLVVATVALGSNPQNLAVTPDGGRVYVTQPFASMVRVIDTSNNAVVASVPVANAWGIAAHPDGSRIYVTTDASVGVVSAIEVASNSVIATIPAAAFPRGVAVNPAGTRVYVANLGGQLQSGLSVIDASNNTLVTTIELGLSPYGVAVSPDGTRVYVSNNGSSTVSVVDATTNTLIGDFSVAPASPTGIGVSADNTSVYVAHSQPSGVDVFDIRCLERATTIAVGSNPIGLAFRPAVAAAPLGPPGPAVEVTSIEVTQGIQNPANDVPLLNSRRTYARVHVAATGAAVAGVTARLSAIASFTSGGGTTLVPLAPLMPSGAGGPTITVNPNPHRELLGDSFLFELPWPWTHYEALRLHATLSLPGQPVLVSCQRDVLSAPLLETRDYTTLKVAYVRMSYRMPGLFSVPAEAIATTSINEQLRSESWMRRTFPVSRLESGPDFELFDAALGAWVDQSNPACQLAYPLPEDRNLCAFRHVTTRLAALQVSTGFIGDADVAYGLIPQYSRELFTRGACCTAGIGAGPANDDDYASHEIGHFLGRQHPVEGSGNCKHSPVDALYPYFYTFIAPPLFDPNTSFAGFDGGDAGLLRPMQVLPPLMGFDIMGYCQPTTWISDYTYGHLKTCLLALNAGGVTPGCGPAGGAVAGRRLRGPQAPQPGDWLALYGHVAADLGHADILASQRLTQVYEQPPRPPGDFSLRLVDGIGATLADYSFAPLPMQDGESTTSALLGFGHVVPFVAGTRQVQIVHVAGGGSVLASRAVSATAPVVASVAIEVAPDPVTGLTTIAWSASDADGDALTFDILVARGATDPLQPLVLGLDASPATLDTSALGGGLVRFRVLASDGVQTGFADSATTTLPNRPPQPRILAPATATQITLGQSLNFEAAAKDAQDGNLTGSALTWSTDQGVLGTGERISVASLPLGSHAVTLTATNSLGLSATRSVTVVVAADAGTPGPTMTVGPVPIGWQVAAGETQLQTAVLHVGNRGSGALAFTATSESPWLTLSATSGTAPATLTLTANPTGFVAGSSVDSAVVLRYAGSPAQQIVVPVRVGVGNTFVVGNEVRPVEIHANGFE